MTTENTETTKKKGSRPTHEIFPVNAEGKPDYKARTGAWADETEPLAMLNSLVPHTSRIRTPSLSAFAGLVKT